MCACVCVCVCQHDVSKYIHIHEYTHTYTQQCLRTRAANTRRGYAQQIQYLICLLQILQANLQSRTFASRSLQLICMLSASSLQVEGLTPPTRSSHLLPIFYSKLQESNPDLCAFLYWRIAASTFFWIAWQHHLPYWHCLTKSSRIWALHNFASLSLILYPKMKKEGH